MTQLSHVPVMLDEVFKFLPLGPGKVYIDGTLGLAGHAAEGCRRVSPGGYVMAVDWDSDLMKLASEKLSQFESVKIRFFHSGYRDLPENFAEAAAEWGIRVGAHGILLDLGLNNAHLEWEERGFAIKTDGPLDMRMDRTSGETAASFLNRASKTEIENTIFSLGDERWARKIAEVIIAKRPLKTTFDLVDCVMAAVPAAKRDKHIHPATRTFQSIRIKINGELDDLQETMENIARCLAPGGVFVVLSYHSGEDRAVKSAFRKLSQEEGFTDLTKKPLAPSEAETARNPKARSAKLRALARK